MFDDTVDERTKSLMHREREHMSPHVVNVETQILHTLLRIEELLIERRNRFAVEISDDEAPILDTTLNDQITNIKLPSPPFGEYVVSEEIVMVPKKGKKSK